MAGGAGVWGGGTKVNHKKGGKVGGGGRHGIVREGWRGRTHKGEGSELPICVNPRSSQGQLWEKKHVGCCKGAGVRGGRFMGMSMIPCYGMGGRIHIKYRGRQEMQGVSNV